MHKVGWQTPEQDSSPEVIFKFKYFSEKLLLSQKLCFFRGSRFSQCFVLSTVLRCSLPSKILCYVLSLYHKCPLPLTSILVKHPNSKTILQSFHLATNMKCCLIPCMLIKEIRNSHICEGGFFWLFQHDSSILNQRE